MSSNKKLSRLSPGQCAMISHMELSDTLCQRLAAFGLYPGAKITAVFRSACGDPTAYLIQSSLIALRKKDTERIYVSAVPKPEQG